MSKRVLTLGDQVEVISNCNSIGRKGIVVTMNKCGSLTVCFEPQTALRTPRLLTFSEKNLKLIGKEEEKEEVKNPAKGDSMTLVKVEPLVYLEEYQDKKTFLVRCYDESIKVEDQVIISCSSIDQECVVTEICTSTKYEDYDGEVISIVDYSKWEKRQAVERKLRILESKISHTLENIGKYHIDIRGEKEIEMISLAKEYLDALEEKFPSEF